MGHDFLGTVIGQRETGPAGRHHLFGALHHGCKRIDGNIHRHGEVGAAGIHVAPAQLVLVGKADGVHDEIQRAPGLLQRRKQRVDRRLVAHVAGQNDVAAQLPGQRLHPFPQRVALVGKGQFRAGIRTGLGDAPGDGFIVCQPHDETAFASH